MTGLRRGYDSASPVKDAPHWDVCLFYCGRPNFTPHVWDLKEIDAQPARYLDPTWVPELVDDEIQAGVDAADFLAYLKTIGAPSGSVVTLDTETAVIPAYVAAFDRTMTSGRTRAEPWFLVKNYGSLDFVIQNPLTSAGRHSAHWRDIPRIDPGHEIRATQFADAAQLRKDFDASLYEPSLPLWDRRPPAPPKWETVVMGDLEAAANRTGSAFAALKAHGF